jgi:peroxiredoxin
MRKKVVYQGMFVVFLVLLLLSPSPSVAKKKVDIVGREILNFTLPSTHDRLITYADEYYGKHHLIITFFPAAFTPI